jgi:deoxyuridine 5'-triphosphate nucleotidohydrolase
MQEEPRVRVMIVDDHPMWRDAVERDLEAAGFTVVATAATGTEALTRFTATRPQVVVLDLQIPPPSGVEVTATVLQQDPSARVLILSASGEQADVLEAVKAGATGYLVKSASAEDLVDAVRRTAAGDAVFTPGLAGLVTPRSGLAARHGVTIVNAPGLVDPGYRGELRVTLLNTGDAPYAARAGDRIAQLLLVPFAAPAVRVVDALGGGPDARGELGFGSSGR